ncbi:MAG: DUF1822 family protein [Cyanobacteria bacterium P01_F01_bin.150]
MFMQSQLYPHSIVPLTNDMHEKAEASCPSGLNLSDTESMYLNLLSIYAVAHYLRRLGYATHDQTEIMTNPVLQSLMDVAPIEVLSASDEGSGGDRSSPKSDAFPQRHAPQSYGLLECRRVMANDSKMCVPDTIIPEERLGYVAVQFNDDLSEAYLIGYLDSGDVSQYMDANGAIAVPLDQLRSLDELIIHLQQAYKPSHVVTYLTNWLKNIVEESWTSLDHVIGPEMQLNYQVREINPSFQQDLRSTPAISKKPRTECAYGKTIRFNTSQRTETVALITEIIDSSSADLSINLKICPPATKGEPKEDHSEKVFLPPGLEMVIVDETGDTVMQVQSRDENRTIKLGFEAEPGDRFQLHMSLDDTVIVESFLV